VTAVLLCICLQVTASAAVSTTPSTAFMPAQLSEITEPAAQQMAARMQRTPVPISSLPTPPIETAFVGPSKQQQAQLKALSNAPPVVLLHGFDSSCLEFRRLYPLLESRTETWAVDLVSWLQAADQLDLGCCVLTGSVYFLPTCQQRSSVWSGSDVCACGYAFDWAGAEPHLLESPTETWAVNWASLFNLAVNRIDPTLESLCVHQRNDSQLRACLVRPVLALPCCWCQGS
jgi:hypothetical protein